MAGGGDIVIKADSIEIISGAPTHRLTLGSGKAGLITSNPRSL